MSRTNHTRRPGGLEQHRRARLADQIRQKGRGHREPVALYRKSWDETPAVVGVVAAIETDGVRMVSGAFVPWSGVQRVRMYWPPAGDRV
jgi:hypothetical protein